MKRVRENNLPLINFDFAFVSQIIFSFLWNILRLDFLLTFFRQNENSTISSIIFNGETFEFDTIAKSFIRSIFQIIIIKNTDIYVRRV